MPEAALVMRRSKSMLNVSTRPRTGTAEPDGRYCSQPKTNTRSIQRPGVSKRAAKYHARRIDLENPRLEMASTRKL